MTEDNLKYIAEICKQTWEPLYRFIYYKVQNREEAEDITQETYARSLSWHGFDRIGPGGYMPFFKTVAMNIIRDRWRLKKTRGTEIDIDSIAQSEAANADIADITNRQLFIRRSLDRLTEEQQKVVELRIIKGYSVSETAGLMGIKEGNVRVLQYRALKTLATVINEEEDCHE